jgi:hypothetical protein
MLEYCDKEARQEVIKLIYEAYETEKKKHCLYGGVDIDTIQDWEDFRSNWLIENIGNPLKERQNG